MSVIFPGALGDFVCFYPALLAILERHASSAMEIFTHPSYVPLLPQRSAPLRVHSLETPQISRLFVAGAADDDVLRRFFGRYRRVYTWMASRDPDFLANLEMLARGRVEAYRFRPAGSGRPMVEYYLSCVNPHRPAAPISATLPIGREAAEWAEGFWRSYGLCGRRVLALAPGSGAREKNWPESAFSLVAEWWQNRTGGVALAILGPVEEERKTDKRMALPPGAVVIRELGLGPLTALLSRCDCYLGNDSGTTHVAAAVGIPTVAVFGPTNPREWKPWGRAVKVVTHPVSCSPCDAETMRACGHRSCLADLDPDRVLRTLEQELTEVILTNGATGI